jgi:nucleoid-associated protein YgaU
MKLRNALVMIVAVVLTLSVGVATAQEMTKEQWQQEMNKLTQTRNDLQAKLKALDASISSLTSESNKLDGDLQTSLDALYALVGSDREKADAYRSELDAPEAKAADLMRLSDADLMARSSEVTDLDSKIKELWGNKLSLIPEFWDRLTALDTKVKSLKETLTKQVKVYTVGTWSKDRDCLWNISKKPDIYDNAWLWPRIWQGNRDQIKDPDIIHTGQMLKIPQGKEMNDAEKAAAKKYYHKVAARAAAAPAANPAEPAKK